ncbi:MAG: type III-A CRISPR-associated protein Csm2 [Acutalibacteraceae bacterium]|nr:type III-A CRISPR-associated protein Csm2 [Acutalibacteraceae bacterium]
MDYQELTSDNYVDYAQSVIRYLNSQSDKLLTTSQIRNMLSLNSEIYNMVIIENQSSLSDNVKAKLQYLKVRMVYDSGREEKVMAFVVKSNLIRHIDWIDGDKERYILFSKYMEALVAFRKFEGNGTDK